MRHSRRYRDGLIGLQENEAKHIALLEEASKSGCAAARRDLGEMHEWGGGGVQKDETKALKLYKVCLDDHRFVKKPKSHSHELT